MGPHERFNDDMLIELDRKVDEHIKGEMVEHDRVRTAVEENSKLMNKILDAFPEQDVRGHRDYHDQLIAKAKSEAYFWRDLKLDLAKKGLWAVLLVVVGLLVTGAATKLGITPKG